jgi:minor extracellular protease Epr
MMPIRFVLMTTLAMYLAVGQVPFTAFSLPESGAAWADDDGDGDDGGVGEAAGGNGDPDGNRNDGAIRPGGGFLERLFLGLWPQPQRAMRRPPPPSPPPEFAADEIVALSLSDDDLSALIAQGFAVLEETSLPGIAATPRRLSIPGDVPLAEARDIVRQLASGQDADFNHF